MRQSDLKRMPKPAEPKQVLLRKGTQIKTEGGELFATLARDVVSGQAVMPSDFEFADGQERRVGDEMPEEIKAFLQTAAQFQAPKTP
jgi:hypothetical protein